MSDESSSSRVLRVCRCVGVAAYVLAVVALSGFVGYSYVYEVLYAEYLQGARDIAFDAKRGLVIVASLHADSLTLVDARGETPQARAPASSVRSIDRWSARPRAAAVRRRSGDSRAWCRWWRGTWTTSASGTRTGLRTTARGAASSRRS